MSRQYWVAPVGPFATASNGATNTFTVFQQISDTAPSASINLPANMLDIGSELRLDADGEFSTTGTPTLALGFLIGSTKLCEGTLLATSTTGASWPWHAEAVVRVRAIGVSGTASVYVAGWYWFGTSLTAVTATIPMPPTAAARVVSSGIDTTVANLIKVGAEWGTSSASNTIKVDRFSVDLRT